MDQPMQSSYSATINLAHRPLPVKQEHQPDETQAQPDVGFVVVDQIQPFKLALVLGQGLGMDQLMQSSYSASINLAHRALPVKQEQQPDETQAQADVGFVDVDQIQPFKLPLVLGQDVDPLLLPRTFQSQNLSSLPEPRHFKQEVLDNVKREPPEMQFYPMTSHGTLNADQDVDPLQLSSLPESRCLRREVEFRVKQEPSRLLNGLVEASKICSAELQNDLGSSSLSVNCTASFGSTIQEYKCTECDVEYVSLDHLYDHVKNHSTKNMMAGDLNENRFRLGKNRPPFSEEKPYDCDTCEARFTQSSNLTRHKRSHSGKKPHVCDICKAMFTQSSSLTDHKRSHSGEKPYVCDTCEARFTQQSTLTKHKRTHSGEKPYVCDTCEARFTQQSTLTKHKRLHSGEKPYACDTCKARFTQSYNLTIHKRSHTGEKPYACDKCEARFTKSTSLSEHKRSHSGEKPYVCDTCEARFTQRSTLTKHKRTHSGEKPHA